MSCFLNQTNYYSSLSSDDTIRALDAMQITIKCNPTSKGLSN